MLIDVITKGTTDYSTRITIIDSTDGSPEQAVEHNTSGISLWYRRQGAAKVAITPAALSALTDAHTDGGIEHIDDGDYRLDLPDAAVATGADYVDVGGTVTGMIVIGGRIQLDNASVSTATPTWEDSETRTRRCAITIQASKVAGTITDYEFTVTKDMLPSEMFDADGSNPAQNGGGDIRFMYDGNQLPCDIVTFTTDNDPANGTAEINVLVPSVSGSVNTTIYCYYNTSGTSSQPGVATAYGAENAYRSTNKMTLTMKEDPSGSAPQLIDRTSNSYDATSNGSMTSGDVVTGALGSAIDFDGSDDYITTNVGAAIKAAGTGDYAVVCLVNRNSAGVRDEMFVFKSSDASDDVGFVILNTNVVFAFIKWDGGSYNSASSSGTVSGSTWTQVGMIRQSGTLRPLLNGSTAGGSYSSSEDMSLHAGTDAAWMGSNHTAYSIDGSKLSGKLDDVRVYCGTLGADFSDFVATRKENQLSPAAFAVAGTPEAVSGGGGGASGGFPLIGSGGLVL